MINKKRYFLASLIAFTSFQGISEVKASPYQNRYQYNNVGEDHLFAFMIAAYGLTIVVVIGSIIYSMRKYNSPEAQYDRAKKRVSKFEQDEDMQKLLSLSDSDWRNYSKKIIHESFSNLEQNFTKSFAKSSACLHDLEKAQNEVSSALNRISQTSSLYQSLNSLQRDISNYIYAVKQLNDRLNTCIILIRSLCIIRSFINNSFFCDLALVYQDKESIVNCLYRYYLNERFPVIQSENFLRSYINSLNTSILDLERIRKTILGTKQWLYPLTDFFESSLYRNVFDQKQKIEQVLVIINRSCEYRQEVQNKQQEELERRRIEAQERKARAAQERVKLERERLYAEREKVRLEREKLEREKQKDKEKELKRGNSIQLSWT